MTTKRKSNAARNRGTRFGIFVAAMALSAACGAQETPQPAADGAMPGDDVTAFVGVRVVDGTGVAPIEDATLLVRGSLIEAVGARDAVAIPDGSAVVDLAGRTIIPGLVNTHAHVGPTEGLRSDPELWTEANVLRQLQLYARYGITTVVSLGGEEAPAFAVRDGQADEEISEARFYVAGPVITAATPDEARTRVDEVAALGPDFIKIRVDDNLGRTEKMTPDVYQAVIDQAHSHGLQVAAHIFYLADAKALVSAGVDFLAHSVRDAPVDAELIEALVARGVCVMPTLTRELSTFVYRERPAFFEDPFFTREVEPAVLTELEEPERQAAMRESETALAYEAALDVAKQNLAVLHDAGVGIAFGTDSGVVTRFQGYFEHLELEMMADAGLSPAEILHAATAGSAACMGLDERVGTLAPGLAADFVVLQDDPLEDIRNTRTIESVWIAGRRIPGR